MPISSTKKEMQWLMDRLVTLGWFITCFTDKLRYFFTILRGTQTFSWTKECKSAFDAIKHYLIEPHILSSLEVGEKLYMYFTMSDYAVSVVS